MEVESKFLTNAVFLSIFLFGSLSNTVPFNFQSAHAHMPKTHSPTPHNFVNTLKLKFRNLPHLPNIRPFNGEIIVTLKGETIVQHPIRMVKGIQSSPQVGQLKYVIASLTKQMTAALILQAVEKGMIHLDDPAAKYLAPKIDDDLSLTKYQATIHELLAHMSGYVDGSNYPVSPPGSMFNYASWSYAVLGHILAHIHGRPFPEIANQFFARIGMDNALAPERAKVKSLRQQNQDLIRCYHCHEDDSFMEANPEIGGNRGAAGAVMATAQDLALWNHALHSGELLSPPSYERMIQPYSQSVHDVFGPIGYGYGIQIAETNAGLEYSHLGHIPGFQSMMLYYPQSQLGVVLLINSDRLGQDDSHNAYEHLRIIRQIAIETAAGLS
jgi:D-alanyl-D-alanine carboxypeptidase